MSTAVLLTLTRHGAAVGSIVMRLPIRNQGKAKVSAGHRPNYELDSSRREINEHIKLSGRAARYKNDLGISIIERG